MNWEKREDGSWIVTPITVDEEKFLDEIFATLTQWKGLWPHYETVQYPFTDRCKE